MECSKMGFSKRRSFRMGLLAAAGVAACAVSGSLHATDSVAKQWNETTLESIKKDLVRPPIQARNLFHLSVAMYDAWACYDASTEGYFFAEKITAKGDVEAARHESISYAAYRLLKHRFALSPNVTIINGYLDARMAALGYPTNVTTTVGNSPAAVGNRIAALVIQQGLADNSREEFNHAKAPGTYPDVNQPLVVALPFNPTVSDPTRYQPLALDFFVDQNGNVIPGGFPAKVAPFWGSVTPFAIQPSEMDPARSGVLTVSNPPPVLNGVGDVAWRFGHEDVIRLSSQLTPDDGVMMDISPAVLGNNTLGTNDGTGHALNPATGLPYPPNVVRRGDWARCLAEFWADGPNSTTPPGHWNEIANHVIEHPSFERRMGGKGPELGPLEWDVKMYVTLNGALHDAAITAWGLKGYYDTMRPIGAIRYMAQRGQCSDPAQPKFDLNGLHLAPGLVEVITIATTQPGQRHEDLAGYEGEIAIRGWPGAPASPTNQYSGIHWMLAGNWVSYQRPTFVTPPFAGYVSGHSTYSRAGAEVMTALTGSEFFPGGYGEFICAQNQFLVFEDGPSQTFAFQWATYYDAADQSGLSRLFGGIHPDFDDFEGRRLGSLAGQRAFAKAQQLFETSSPCPVDFDNDGVVGASDLSQILANWGSSNATYDLDADGTIGASDLSLLLAAWGDCP
jgi:hypothetical protein